MKKIIKKMLANKKQKQAEKKAHNNWIKTFRMVDEWRKEQEQKENK